MGEKMTTASQNIPVRLAGRRYALSIGCGHTPSLGKTFKQADWGNLAIVLTNPTIRSKAARQVMASFKKARVATQLLTVPDTERSKSMSSLSRLLNQLAGSVGPGMRPVLVLVGGGVIGDLGGLAAGLYKRGIPYIQVPTTLLAQVDSSIGGKTAVDLPQGKNLVGLILQPKYVHCDTAFLKTLPERQFRSGLVEAFKSAIIGDTQLFGLLERRSVEQIRKSPSDLRTIVSRAARVKVKVVELDEFETKGIRMKLNLGHTFGHALEAAVNYSSVYTHGEAVAIGTVVATRIARSLKLISAGEADRIVVGLDQLGFPIRVGRKIKRTVLYDAMSKDKKWTSGAHRWVLPRRVGQVVVKDGVPVRMVRQAIESVME